MEDNDLAAVARARKGDDDAFRLLVERHSRSVFRVAYRMTGCEQDAEDLVQETFLRVYRNLGAFQERANFGTWIYRIAVNCSLDWLRKRRPLDELKDNSEPDYEESAHVKNGPTTVPDRMIMRLEVRDRVRNALEDLSPMEKAAFVLRHFEGMSIEEISGTLGMHNNAAKHSIFRAVRKMRRALAPIASLAE
jgi:RNA polymerase sigma-70 factor (ECF subfamily)